ncbi:hypothetical protein GDO78_022525, partial [Eleutherodactylus coqui]
EVTDEVLRSPRAYWEDGVMALSVVMPLFVFNRCCSHVFRDQLSCCPSSVCGPGGGPAQRPPWNAQPLGMCFVPVNVIQ